MHTPRHELLAKIPFLIGFHPSDSIVAVGVHDRRAAFVARHDLPCSGTGLGAALARQALDAALVVGYGPPERVTPAVHAAVSEVRASGLPVIDALRVAGDRYWSYLCSCCPDDGIPFSAESTAAAAEAVYQGAVAHPDRAAFLAQLDPVTGSERATMAVATARARSPIPRARGRAIVRQAEIAYHGGEVPAAEQVARLGAALRVIPVRDYAVSRLGPDRWRRRMWTDVLRRVEPPHVPAPATLLALTAWRMGDGALARAAVDRALAADPGYHLAVAVAHGLDMGLPPSAAGQAA